MREDPNAKDLLEAARAALMEEILPALPAESRYRAHLIAAAMATAVREIEAGEGAAEAQRAALADLLGETGDLETLCRALAAAIREGRFDDSGEAHRILLDATHARLAAANPRYLAED